MTQKIYISRQLDVFKYIWIDAIKLTQSRSMSQFITELRPIDTHLAFFTGKSWAAWKGLSCETV